MSELCNTQQKTQKDFDSSEAYGKYLRAHPFLMKLRRQEVAKQNKSLIPEFDKRYYCGSCGSKSGACHPVSGYCFMCDTDNWVVAKYDKENMVIEP